LAFYGWHISCRDSTLSLPFVQLYDGNRKQVLVAAVLVSSRKAKDYLTVLQGLKSLLPALRPTVSRRGLRKSSLEGISCEVSRLQTARMCLPLHASRVEENTKKLGLQEDYSNDNGTNLFCSRTGTAVPVDTRNYVWVLLA
jgi:hypothetical protein